MSFIFSQCTLVHTLLFHFPALLRAYPAKLAPRVAPVCKYLGLSADRPDRPDRRFTLLTTLALESLISVFARPPRALAFVITFADMSSQPLNVEPRRGLGPLPQEEHIHLGPSLTRLASLMVGDPRWWKNRASSQGGRRCLPSAAVVHVGPCPPECLSR